MPRAAAVIRYQGARGTVWRIKYADTTGRQVMETLGREADGWTEQKAERALGKRLDRVERERWRKPTRTTFEEFANRWLDQHVPSRGLKHTTVDGYRLVVHRHLTPYFGPFELTAIEPELIDSYIGHKARNGLSGKTITNHLLILNAILKRAVRWRLIPTNPVEAVDRPRVRKPQMHVLSETEVARLWTAYGELAVEAENDDRPWWLLTRAVTFTALGTALRRGELLGLRWRDVSMLEGRLTVREAFVNGRFTTPKSDESRRTIELGPRTVEILREHWRTSAYQGDDELVFGHPTKGTPADPSKLSRYARTALKKAGITKPVRAFHDMRHSSLTHAAAAGNPAVYVQHRAGHAQASTTERYIHAGQVLFPGAADAAEARLFAELEPESRVESPESVAD